mgnify:CR=1 FL=1
MTVQVTEKTNIEELKQKALDAAFQVLVLKAELIVTLAKMMVHVDTGKLRDSIRYEIMEDSEGKKTVRVVAGGSGIDYAAIQEEKYPFLKPAFDAVMGDTVAEMKTAITEKCS